jgi:hypothetical protein
MEHAPNHKDWRVVVADNSQIVVVASCTCEHPDCSWSFTHGGQDIHRTQPRYDGSR